MEYQIDNGADCKANRHRKPRPNVEEVL